MDAILSFVENKLPILKEVQTILILEDLQYFLARVTSCFFVEFDK